MTDLPSLLARVKEATGPDSKFDQDLWEALTGECTHREVKRIEFDDDSYSELKCVACGADTYGKDRWTGISRSLDAALALCERVLPGWEWTIAQDWHDGPLYFAELAHRLEGKKVEIGHPFSPALALLAALITARMEQKHD